MNLKNNKGFTQLDIITSVIIVTVFVSMIASLFANLYTQYKQVERKTEAIYIAIETIENIKQLEYSKVTSDITNIDKLNDLLEDENKIEAETGYTVKIEVNKYTREEENVEDIIKNIKVSVSYTVNKSVEEVTLETLISAN